MAGGPVPPGRRPGRVRPSAAVRAGRDLASCPRRNWPVLINEGRGPEWVHTAGGRSAVATATMTLSHGADTFTDIFLLVRTDDSWRIANKAYHRNPEYSGPPWAPEHGSAAPRRGLDMVEEPARSGIGGSRPARLRHRSSQAVLNGYF
ncbi:nuclear transport factor 2 family protein [Streptomyces sp. NPDC050085]|uniref:nuclear transport factor 2 family protein n=1 Tax=Streptomyces sp. NPDC050085 TaxID=3365600 RepID=UPI0037A0CCC9